MIYHLQGNVSILGLGERAGDVAREAFPGVAVDFCFQSGFQCLVGIVLAEEVGLSDKEALAVVVRVHEPAGDVASEVMWEGPTMYDK